MARIVSAFGTSAVEAMLQAFDDACRKLPASSSDEVRDIVARRIIGTAAFGERDPAKLREDALAYVTEP